MFWQINFYKNWILEKKKISPINKSHSAFLSLSVSSFPYFWLIFWQINFYKSWILEKKKISPINKSHSAFFSVSVSSFPYFWLISAQK